MRVRPSLARSYETAGELSKRWVSTCMEPSSRGRTSDSADADQSGLSFQKGSCPSGWASASSIPRRLCSGRNSRA